MSDPATLTVTLAPASAVAVDEAIARGEYDNPAEIVQEAMAEWRLRRRIQAADVSSLRALAIQGIESGPGLKADEVFARLAARYAPKPLE